MINGVAKFKNGDHQVIDPETDDFDEACREASQFVEDNDNLQFIVIQDNEN